MNNDNQNDKRYKRHTAPQHASPLSTHQKKPRGHHTGLKNGSLSKISPDAYTKETWPYPFPPLIRHVATQAEYEARKRQNANYAPQTIETPERQMKTATGLRITLPARTRTVQKLQDTLCEECGQYVPLHEQPHDCPAETATKVAADPHVATIDPETGEIFDTIPLNDFSKKQRSLRNAEKMLLSQQLSFTDDEITALGVPRDFDAVPERNANPQAVDAYRHQTATLSNIAEATKRYEKQFGPIPFGLATKCNCDPHTFRVYLVAKKQDWRQAEKAPETFVARMDQRTLLAVLCSIGPIGS